MGLILSTVLAAGAAWASGGSGQPESNSPLSARVVSASDPSSGLNDLLSRANSGAMVNGFTGQAAFSVALGTVTAQNGLAYPVTLSYYGATDRYQNASKEFVPGGWVGAGFSLKAPSISVSGIDLDLAAQKYTLSLDGVSAQELVQIGTGNTFVPKNDPTIMVIRSTGTRTSTLVDRCGSAAGTSLATSVPYISGWTVRLPNGTEYRFGGGAAGNCDAAENELCQPIVGNNYGFKPFYTLQANGKATLVFYLSQIIDRLARSSIFFRYDKVQENVTGSCNWVNTTPTYLTNLDRAIYLKEIYSVNGTSISDAKTGQIVFLTSFKNEETPFDPTKMNVSGFYETKKLGGIQYFERGNLTKTLYFNYTTIAGRLALSNIKSQVPPFDDLHTFLNLGYATNSLHLATIENAQGQQLEYGYGVVNADPINGSSAWFQDMELPDPNPNDGIAYPYPKTRIVVARQIGSKFYVELESWDASCGDNNSKFIEYLYEYENNGTHWKLNRTFASPGTGGCPTTTDFFLSPDGKYFIWSKIPVNAGATSTTLHITDLTTSSPNPPAQTLTYSSNFGKAPNHLELYLYPNFFVAQNADYKNHISFFTRNASGVWAETCPPGLEAANYAAPSTLSPRSNNYSGEDEGLAAGSCQTYGWELFLYPGPNFLVGVNKDRGTLHVFGWDGQLRDYVKGLETSTPTLPNFTSAEVTDATLQGLARPWYKRTTTNANGSQRYDNNWDAQIGRVVVSDNLILINSTTDNGHWKYLYVLGWDGKQLRYLYDQPLRADQASGDAADELDMAAGSDYFVLKNQFSGAGTFQGVFYYKVDLKAWKVTKTKLSIDMSASTSSEDWVLKAYPDYFMLEDMQQGQAAQAGSPALTTDGSAPGTFYKSRNSSYVYLLDANRDPVDITGTFGHTGQPYDFYPSNFSAMGDRILEIDTYGPSGSIATGRYNTWRINASGLQSGFLMVSYPGTDQYYSARLVKGGSIVSLYKKNASEESLKGLRFYPDAFDLVQSAANPQNIVQGAVVVTSLKIKAAGASSSGSDLQTISISYPSSSPDGTTDKVLKNYDAGVPNFKYSRLDFPEGAAVSAYRRDEYGATLPRAEKSLAGTNIKNWFLPDKTSYKKPGGSWDDASYVSRNTNSPSSDAFYFQKPASSSREYFYSAYRPSASYSTLFDSKNGLAKIKVAKSGSKYNLTYDIYQHDLTPAYAGTNFMMLRQTSVFQVANNPCSGADPADPCGNLDASYFTDVVKKAMVASTIRTYDASDRPMATYEWRPDALGTAVTPLDGNPVAGTGYKWVLSDMIKQRQDGAVARCKSDLPTETIHQGIYSANFYGGIECDLIATVSNSPLSSAAILTAEEDIRTENCPGVIPCMGAFGRWEAGASVIQSQVAHTGDRSVKVTQIYGPTINLKLRDVPGFMDRNKGFLVSAWVWADVNSNPAFAVEWRKNANPPVPMSGGASNPDPVKHVIDLAQEYAAAHGGNFPTQRWVKLERIIPYEELTGWGTFGTTPNHDYLRIWIGKGSSATSAPVYVDDVRLHPADAVSFIRNTDGAGLVSSGTDASNEPFYIEYDAWRSQIGIRGKDGMVHASGAVKPFNE
jgi:hypothetical protein